MLTPYNPIFSTGPKPIPYYPLPSATNTASAFDVGATSNSAPVFQSSAYGLPSVYPSPTTSAFDTAAVPSLNGGLQQILSAIVEVLTQLIQTLQANSGGKSNSPSFDQTGTSDSSGSGSSSNNGGPKGAASDSGSSDGSAQGPDTPSKSANKGHGTGWNKNVAVMASSDSQHETMDGYSGGQLVGGYLSDLEKGMDSTNNIDQANAAAEAKDNAGAESTGVTANSLVKGKGGNAVIVTGDNYGNDQDADQLADKLKKDYGMNVKIIKNASPKQLKAALQEMGQQNGQQCMVAVLAHGAKDDSGKTNGMMALGKGDGDQWLSEADLKSEVNQYLSPSYGNVNVLLNSCFSGNFVE